MMKTYLTKQDINNLIEAATNLRDKLLIRVLAYTACRISEALAITVQDIDIKQSTITIKHLKERIKLSCPHCNTQLSKAHKYCPGCSRKINRAIRNKLEQHRRRVIPIDTETINMLKEYIDRSGPVNNNGKLLIFGINRHRAWQVVKACAEKAGITRLVNPETGKIHNVSPHRLRDAFAVHAIKQDDSGDGLRMLQELLGHKSFNTTARYRKVAGDELKEWYNKLWEDKEE